MATLHRPFPLSSHLTPFLTTLSLILFIINTTAASPVLSNSPNSIIQLAANAPPVCEDGKGSIGQQYTKPRPEDCTSLAGQIRYDPLASEKRRITQQEHFLRGSGTCQLFVYTSPTGPDADDASLNDIADGVDNLVKLCLDNPDYTGGSFQAGNRGFLQVWVTGHWDPWPPGNPQGLLEGATASSTPFGNQPGNSRVRTANNTMVSANTPKCEDGSSIIGKQYDKPVAADCTALSQILRTSPAASHEQLITREEKFLRRSGTCQLFITIHPMIRPSQDYASFINLAEGIDSVVESCIDNPSYKGGDIQAGTLKLLTLQVTGIRNPFGPQGLSQGGRVNITGVAAARVDVT